MLHYRRGNRLHSAHPARVSGPRADHDAAAIEGGAGDLYGPRGPDVVALDHDNPFRRISADSDSRLLRDARLGLPKRLGYSQLPGGRHALLRLYFWGLARLYCEYPSRDRPYT